MPELPEVETIARGLREGTAEHPGILQHRIVKSRLLWKRTLAEPKPSRFAHLLKGRRINWIGRRGKFLVFYLEELYMLVHLRMSGDLVIRPVESPVEKHDRLILYMEGEECRVIQMAFNDPRKFGRVWVTSTPDIILGRLGPEPLDQDITPERFHHMLSCRNRQIKPLLLDQSFLAGLGNIYTDEALHLAKLHPLRQAKSLSLSEAGRLLEAIRNVLQEGILRNGASIDWVYRGGEYQNQFRVYGRFNQSCPICGAAIMRIVVGQRSTYFCGHCQAL